VLIALEGRKSTSHDYKDMGGRDSSALLNNVIDIASASPRYQFRNCFIN